MDSRYEHIVLGVGGIGSAAAYWIARRGGLSPHMMYLSGRELVSMYPACQHGESEAKN